MKEQLQAALMERIGQYAGKEETDGKVASKLTCLSKRHASAVKVNGTGRISRQENSGDHTHIYYSVHMKYLIKQLELMYIEEELEERKASFYKGQLYEDIELERPMTADDSEGAEPEGTDSESRIVYEYDRLKAVQYAERWWNDYNPAYRKFDVDCTNYISQCLRAGQAPMRGYPNRSKGWWMQQNNWSYSWAVAHSLRMYLDHSTIGLRAREVSSADELQLGDVICYDFQGDGRYDHNTIVTGKDALGMPLVNAHTYNSRARYWAYEDSSAYTPNIQYRFFTIVDDSARF